VGCTAYISPPSLRHGKFLAMLWAIAAEQVLPRLGAYWLLNQPSTTAVEVMNMNGQEDWKGWIDITRPPIVHDDGGCINFGIPWRIWEQKKFIRPGLGRHPGTRIIHFIKIRSFRGSAWQRSKFIDTSTELLGWDSAKAPWGTKGPKVDGCSRSVSAKVSTLQKGDLAYN
jgi:hypothetical protein